MNEMIDKNLYEKLCLKILPMPLLPLNSFIVALLKKHFHEKTLAHARG